MKIFLYINPITNKPYEFSYYSREDFCIANSEKQEDGTYLTKSYKPIVIEVDKFDISLLEKKYNPETKRLE